MNAKLENILDDKLVKLQLVLDETTKFPSIYLYKFIVPVTQVQKILSVLENMEIEQKASSNGNWISVSARAIMQNSNEIIAIYKKASVIQGVISL